MAQHGRATEENRSRKTAVYRSGPWKVDLEYCDGVACKVTFTRLGQLREEEIQAILIQNAGGATWRELPESGPQRIWQRDDFAQAECNRVKPRAITFRQALPENEGAAPPAALVEANPSPVVESTPPASNYAIEQSAPPRPSPNGVMERSLSVFSDRPLTLVIPAAILLFVFLNKQVSRRKSPVAEPPRRIVTPRPARDLVVTEPAPLTLDSLESHDFELLLGEIFRRQEYDVEISGGLGADGGKDLTLRKGDETLIVQGKHWSDWKVSEPSIRELHDTVMAEGATGGVFVTSGRYTRDALAFAQGKPLRLLARPELEELMQKVSTPNENLCDFSSWITHFAAAARVTNPVCPFCAGSMSLKRSVQGRPFWKCQTFPQCAGKRDGREALLPA